MNPVKKSSRRSFVKKLTGSAALATAIPTILSSKESQGIKLTPNPNKVAANDKIRLGAIACGIMGLENVRTAYRTGSVQLVAACDLYDGRTERIKELYGKEVFTSRKYQDIFDRDDVDAIINSTPDHWHDHISIEAMQKGKVLEAHWL